MNTLSRLMIVAGCCYGGVVIGQDKPDEGAMSATVAAAKTQMLAPETMAAAKKSMMGNDSMMPAMVAKEMIHQELRHDKEAAGMVQTATMAKTPDDKMMMSPERVSMARAKMMAEPTAMQMLFQELVARHIASHKVAMMHKSDPTMSMAGQHMKGMVMDEKAMMGAKKDMLASEHSAMTMAREELIHSLMLDKEVMDLVKQASKMQHDPAVAPMMSDEKIKMEGDSMMKDEGKTKGMMQETMVRHMIHSKDKMMKDDETKPAP